MYVSQLRPSGRDISDLRAKGTPRWSLRSKLRVHEGGDGGFDEYGPCSVGWRLLMERKGSKTEITSTDSGGKVCRPYKRIFEIKHIERCPNLLRTPQSCRPVTCVNLDPIKKQILSQYEFKQHLQAALLPWYRHEGLGAIEGPHHGGSSELHIRPTHLHKREI